METPVWCQQSKSQDIQHFEANARNCGSGDTCHNMIPVQFLYLKWGLFKRSKPKSIKILYTFHAFPVLNKPLCPVNHHLLCPDRWLESACAKSCFPGAAEERMAPAWETHPGIGWWEHPQETKGKPSIYLHGGFLKKGVPPVVIHFNGIFP